MADQPVSPVIPCLRFSDAPAAIDWLSRAFGFVPSLVVPGPNGTIAHAELRFGTGMVMLGSAERAGPDDLATMKTPAEAGGVTQVIYVVIEDADQHHAQAVAAGARILYGPRDTDYGSRDYGALDPEGNLWCFGTYRPGAG